VRNALETLVDLVAEETRGYSGIDRYIGGLQHSLTAIGVDVRLTPVQYFPLARQRPVLRALPRGIEGKRPGSILHIPKIMGSSVLLHARLSPVVVTVHDLGALFCPEDRVLGGTVSRQLLRIALHGLKRADRIIAVSEFTRRGLLQAGFPAEQVITIHEGVDLDRLRPVHDAAEILRERYHIEVTSRPVVLYVGNEFPRKNIATLVRALGQLKRAGLSTRWIKVGSSGYSAGRAELQNLIKREGLNLTEDVAIIEGIPDDDLPLFYSAARVYVQPSIWEGFGLPVLEAMACGTPVVASNAASLPEISGDAAILVEARNADALAGAIGQVVDDQTIYAKLRASGLSHVSSFTWRLTAERTNDLYRQLNVDY
jgi:glycosyltransferase involved in cell wall biosynthesis